MTSGRPFLLVHARVRPAMLDEFRRWYRRVHVPHVLAVPGIVEYRALTVATAAFPGSPNLLSVFEFEDESVIQKALRSSEAAQARRDWERWAEHVRNLSIQVYAGLDVRASVRHLN